MLCVDTCLTQHKRCCLWLSVVCWYLPNSTQAVLPVAQCSVLIPALLNTSCAACGSVLCVDTCLTQHKLCCLWLSVVCWYLPYSTQEVLSVAQCCVLIPALLNTSCAACGSVLCVDTGLTQHKLCCLWLSVVCWYLPNSTQAVLPVAQCCVLIPALLNTSCAACGSVLCVDTCLTQHKLCCLWLSVVCWYRPYSTQAVLPVVQCCVLIPA